MCLGLNSLGNAMNILTTKKFAVTLLMLTSMLGISTVAFAQYIWIDESGVKQYSDMAPPSSIPKKNILKQPGKSYSASQSNSDTPAPAAKSTDGSDKQSAPLTAAEQNAEFQKRKAKQAADEAKAALEAKNAEAKAKYCDSTRSYNRSLASGDRIATTDKNGERSFITDEQRAKEIKETGEALNNCK
jgi:hypothetical protein